ncbi:E3 ubiquitin-protein ligase Topors [Quercus lobata]|uniref:RING-type E3 ubiquitin transferase n=1 Tax=Quercus lobata TaxID=97700 RepID=A0A7N2LWI6_QUELO|nr:E3 ubiquitin-protein ligase Topors [Quercus lobata]
MESSSSSRPNREKMVKKVIWPAIRGRSCPICLKNMEAREAAVLTDCKHAYCVGCIRKWSGLKRNCPLCNSHFDSWFCDISLSSRTFYKERLSALNNNIADNTRNDDVQVGFSRIGHRHRRSIRRIRNELNSLSWQPRSLPWRRSFGRPGSVPLDVIAERKLQWRASIYRRRLRAVSSPSQNCCEQNISGNIGAKERIVQRIGPWIRRELQAILGDSDPSVIVHVASSLFIASLENNNNVHSEQLNVEDESIAPLRRFLDDRTSMFWHELRCFAESSLNMETYDAVVEYEQLG